MNEIDGGAELAKRWLLWVHGAKNGRSPISDPTGEFNAENQPADVWFLAGTYGGAAKRRLDVPADRPVFFPLFNIWGAVEHDLVCHQAGARSVLDGEELPVVELSNDQPISIPREPGKLFGKRKVKIWGLWSSIAALGPGEHVLEIYGEERPNGFWTQVHYELTAR